MSHGGDLDETCHFGHIFEAWEGGGDSGLQDKIRNGEIESLSELESDDDFQALPQLFEQWKKLKVSSKGQGTAFAALFTAIDDLDDKGYSVTKIDESVHIDPQSNMHAEFMQRKQQAEQNIKQTMQSYQQLIKQKHMLEHDIRKLRSRVEAMDARDETLLKGDFIELVDGAGQSPRQGGDQMSLKAYRDQNIYPSIVADFNEMESADDLKTAEQKAKGKDDKDEDDFEDGTLANLPRNEKAILKKKWKMYEQWKDLYGSEVSRKLDELKGQLQNVERSIEETKEWLEPYVRDASMINRMGNDQTKHDSYLNVRGNSTMQRGLDYIVHRPMELDEHGELQYSDEENATHYRIILVKGVHVNIASFSQPQSPADGPSAGVVMWFPAFVCRHVFENIFKEKINEHGEMVDNIMDDYVGGFNPDESAEKLKEARQEAEMSVRNLRENIEDWIDESDDYEGPVPIELSSQLRRVEDGLDPISSIEEKYLKAIDSILEDELDDKFVEDEEDGDSEMYSGFEKKRKAFFGQTDDFYMSKPEDGLKELTHDLRYEYYWGLKLGLGLYTMK